MWDEDGHPIRVSFNPVEYASRTTAFIRSSHTYAIIADNIKKDDAEHLYEWTMMTEWNNDIMSIAGNDIIMGDYRTPWSEFENPSRNIPPRDMKPGQELLLVRILNRNVPKLARDYRKLPSARLEIFEKKDMIDPSGRSFGVNKRIIIPTYASQPKFRILLYPFRYGDDLPETSYDSANDTVVLRFANRTEYVDLKNSIYTTE